MLKTKKLMEDKPRFISFYFNFSLQDIIFIFIYVLNLLLLYFTAVYDLIYPYFTYVSLALLCIILVFSFKLKISLIELMISIAVLITAFINTRINHLAIGEYYELVWFYGLYFILRMLKPDLSIQRILLLISIATIVYLCFYAIKNHDAFVKAISVDREVLKLKNLINPNGVGLGTLLLYWFMRYHLTHFKKKSLIMILMTVFAIVSIYLSESRACFIIFIFTIFFHLLFGNYVKGHKIIAVLIMIAVITIGFIFPVFYIILWKKLGFKAEFLGKPLFTGRERIWAALFDYMKKYPSTYLFGTGKVEAIFWHEKFNLHNSYLAMYSMFGLLPLVGFYCFIILKIKKSYNKSGKMSEKQLCLYIIVLSILIISIVETTLTYILTLIYIILALALIGEEKELPVENQFFRYLK